MSTGKSVEQLHKEHKEMVAKRDGKDYFTHMLDMEKENPGVHTQNTRAALDWAERSTNLFMDKVYNYNHPEHEKTIGIYRDKYQCNKDAVYENFKKEAFDLLGVKKFEPRNAAYENNVFANYRLQTSQDQAFHAKFKNYMQTKWAAVGYDGDENFVAEFWNLHPLSYGDNSVRSQTISEDGLAKQGRAGFILRK